MIETLWDAVVSIGGNEETHPRTLQSRDEMAFARLTDTVLAGTVNRSGVRVAARVLIGAGATVTECVARLGSYGWTREESEELMLRMVRGL